MYDKEIMHQPVVLSLCAVVTRTDQAYFNDGADADEPGHDWPGDLQYHIWFERERIEGGFTVRMGEGLLQWQNRVCEIEVPRGCSV